MSDEKTEIEKKAHAEGIKRFEETEHKARGNVHSEPTNEPAQDAPPPLPN